MLLGGCWVAGLAGFAAPAHAAAPAATCPAALAPFIAQAATIDAEGGKAAQVVAATCKRWPHDDQILLAAYAFATGDDESKVLVVSTVDADTLRVKSHHKVLVGEDAAVAVGETSLALDTAPYRLAPDVRAFGLRFTSAARGASCADGSWHDELTLFVVQGAKLKPVLQGLAMKRAEAQQGCFGSGNSGTLVYDDATLSLGMAKQATHGYADLVASARIVRHHWGAHADEEQLGPVRTERQTLRFDGEQYRPVQEAPWWLLQFPLGQ